MPSKSTWCCGHGVIPAERHGKPTGAPGQAQIHAYEDMDGDDDAMARYHAVIGVVRCASPHVCPVCGAKIQAKRRKDVSFVTKRMLELGYTYVFATFTAGHKFGDKLIENVEKFQESSRKMKQGKAYKALTTKWDIKHYIRTAETTLDHPESTQKTGWHWHGHHILYLNRPHLTREEAEQLEAELSALWAKACAKYDLKVSLEHGLRIERPHFKSKKDGVIYLDDANAKRLGDYAAKTVSFEAAPAPNVKKGRKGQRISSWELIGLVVFGKRKDLLGLLSEFLIAMKGRRSMYMSRGLAALTGLDELDDEEVMKGKGNEGIYAFDDESWSKFSRHGKVRSAMHKLDDGMPVREVVKATIDGCISMQQLERIDMQLEEAALEVFDEDTGEVLISREDVQGHFAGDYVPKLEVIDRSPDKKNQAPARPAGCRSAA
ncbi:protein rep [Solidesulfovibrio carbinolicus]|uniref:protein rep n=1 Tax=Solidesulfovibrio carbinolicus TaxID=296842 RepID=UPI001012747C|nr:protein rep [Solidesulfovibrio carbinolicus]